MPDNEWLGFAAQLLVMAGGFAAIGTWMAKRFEDMKAWMEVKFEVVDERFRSVNRQLTDMKSDIDLVRAEGRDAHAAIARNVRDVEQRLGDRIDGMKDRFDDMKDRFGDVKDRIDDFRDVTASRIEDLKDSTVARIDDLKEILTKS